MVELSPTSPVPKSEGPGAPLILNSIGHRDRGHPPHLRPAFPGRLRQGYSQLENRSEGSKHSSLGLKYTTRLFDGGQGFRVAARRREEIRAGSEFRADLPRNRSNLRAAAAQPFTMASMHQVETEVSPAVY